MTTVTVGQAIELILSNVELQPSLRLPLKNSLGHHLYDDVHAPRPLPPSISSSMDGYAVRAKDIEGAGLDSPIVLPVAGHSLAGDEPPPSLPRNSAWRVATGGPIPDGADTVIRQEDTNPGEASVEIFDDRDSRKHLRPTGGDLKESELALKAGTRIEPQQQALLAALGEATPLVFRRPIVAVITSGNELISLGDAGQLDTGNRLFDSNQPMIEGLVGKAGGTSSASGPVADDPLLLESAVRANEQADLLLTAGAASVGQHDHVPTVMASLGAKILFRRVLVRPGGPATAALLPSGQLWIALPGNPVSAMVTFKLLVQPAIRAMLGDPRPIQPFESVILNEPVSRHPRLCTYPRVKYAGAISDCPRKVALTGPQASWVLTSLTESCGIVEIQPGEGDLEIGSKASFLRW